MEQRKETERRQYDNQARPFVGRELPTRTGAAGVDISLRAPYLAFEAAVRRHATPGGVIVDLGAGTGTFSMVARGEGRTLVATDISRLALLVARRRAAEEDERLMLVCADAEHLPFRAGAVDLVTSAGALYCFDLGALKNEVRRVLRRDGAWVLVDSLNDSPLYRLNRAIGWFRGKRTTLAVRNVPSAAALEGMGSHFATVDVAYFGVLAFLLPVLRAVFGGERAGAIVDGADRRLRGLRRWAFKAVVVAKGTPRA